MTNTRIIKGNILHTPTMERFEVYAAGYMIIEDGKISGLYDNSLPEQYAAHPVDDYGDRLIIPPFCDVHLHAPQFNNVGLGMDMQLLEWLNAYTFPEEARFKATDYAENVYKRLINRLYEVGSLNFVAFGSIYTQTDLKLMELVEASGLRALVGKVNMDRNSPDFYVEDSEQSFKETVEYIEKSSDFKNVAPIITPRFVPSCSKELMKRLGALADKYDLFIQSHLNENRNEIAWVSELFPEYDSYLDIYDKLGLLRDRKTVMAHCIWMTDRDIRTMADRQIMAAHCPFSNADLASGIAPVAKLLQSKVPVGLASDISGGHELYMPKVIAMTAELAKLNMCHVDSNAARLSDSECFYMATAQGEYFFEGTGSFKVGNRADFLVIDDSRIANRQPDDLVIRLMRFIYTGSSDMIINRAVNGKDIKKPF